MKLLVCTQVLDENHPILGFFHGWVLEFAQHFDEVHVICLQKGEYSLPSHVHVYSLGKEEGENRGKYVWRFYKYFAHIFFTVHVDFVFFHMGAIYNILGAPFFLVRALFKTKFYWWKTHGHLNMLGKIGLLFVDRVYTAASVSFPMETKKKYVVGHAIDTHVETVRQKEFETIKTVLFVGRVTPVKGIEYVLQAAKLLQAKGVPVRVRIVGVLPDPAYEAELRKKVQALELGSIVTFVGPVKHDLLEEEYQTADVVINPSKTGGIDKVVLEAMKFGTPVVALEETYGSLLTPFGLAIEKQDAQLYAEALEKIFAYTPSEKEELALLLRKEVVEHHALHTLSKRIFNI